MRPYEVMNKKKNKKKTKKNKKNADLLGRMSDEMSSRVSSPQASISSMLASTESLKLGFTSQCESMLDKLNKMRLEEDGTDVIVTCAEATFPAHKCILMAASPVFDTMFRSSFKEAEMHNVDMCLEPKIMAKVLDFIYLGENSPMTFEDVKEVAETIEAAHYVQIEKLFLICCDKFTEIATKDDFPLLCSLSKYDSIETIRKAFASKYGLKILKDNLHLKYTFDEFGMFVKEMNHVATPEELVNEILKWIKNDATSREKHALEMISLTDLSGMSREMVKPFLDDEIVKNNQNVLVLLLERFVVAPEKNTAAAPENSTPEKATPNPEPIVSQLRLCQFLISDHGPSCWITAFNSKSDENVVYYAFPFKVDPSTQLFSFSSHIYFPYGSYNSQNAINYAVDSNMVQYPWNGYKPLPLYPKLDQIIMVQGKLLAITKPNEEGKGFVYIENTIENKFESVQYDVESFSNPIWIPCEWFLVQICRSENLNRVTVYTFQGAGKTHFLSNTMFFHSEFEFSRNNTVSFNNIVYSFRKNRIYKYDPSKNVIECWGNSITVNDDDVLFPLYDHIHSFYIVIRQHFSQTDFVYKLWKYPSKTFAAEIKTSKRAMCETVAIVSS